MKYRFLTTDFGQGVSLLGLPVSYHNGEQPAQLDKPFSVHEVLTRYYGEDFGLTLGNFLKMEVEYLHANGVMRKSQNIRLLSYYHKMTRSRLEQNPSETVVDFIVHGIMEGDIEAENRTVRESNDFRIRYILNMAPCSRECIGPIINLYQGDDVYLSRFPIPTNDYLLPILYAKDYENVAHRMLQYYFPEIENRISGGFGAHISAEELAKRMGLKIEEVHFKDPSIMGQLSVILSWITCIAYSF